MFNSYRFKLKLAVLFIVGTVGLVVLTSSTNAKVSNDNFNKVVTTDASGKYSLDQDAATVIGKVEILTERDIIVEMHEMANKYIVAPETWGTKEMTLERINALIVETLSYPSTTMYQHKRYLLEILTNWKKGEFSQLAADHNYLWDCLFGTVGRATGVKGIEDLPAWAIGK